MTNQLKALKIITAISLVILLYRAIVNPDLIHFVFLVSGYFIGIAVYGNPLWIVNDIKYLLSGNDEELQ